MSDLLQQAKELLQEMDNSEIGTMYGYLLSEFKNRKISRTNNFVGELGERLAINYYNENPLLPNLQAVQIGTKSVDAVDTNNERYSIKAITTKTTGVFNGLNDPDSDLEEEQKFEYVVIVMFDKMDLSLKAIYQLDWPNFLSLKKWNNSKRTWYLSVNRQLKENSKTIFIAETNKAT